MDLSEKEINSIEDRIAEIVVLYGKVKRLIIKSEKIEEQQRLSITAINELRSALDHLMRVFAAKNGISDNVAIDSESTSDNLPAPEYCEINMNKAFGHIYRAGYDAYDIISLEYIKKINSLRKTVSHGSLVKGFNDYANEVRLPFKEAIDICNEAKATKDVEALGTLAQHFGKYERATDALESIYETMEQRWPDVLQCEEERLQEQETVIRQLKGQQSQSEIQIQQYKNQLKLAWLAIIISVLFGLGGIILTLIM